MAKYNVLYKKIEDNDTVINNDKLIIKVHRVFDKTFEEENGTLHMVENWTPIILLKED